MDHRRPFVTADVAEAIGTSRDWLCQVRLGKHQTHTLQCWNGELRTFERKGGKPSPSKPGRELFRELASVRTRLAGRWRYEEYTHEHPPLPNETRRMLWCCRMRNLPAESFYGAVHAFDLRLVECDIDRAALLEEVRWRWRDPELPGVAVFLPHCKRGTFGSAFVENIANVPIVAATRGDRYYVLEMREVGVGVFQ